MIKESKLTDTIYKTLNAKLELLGLQIPLLYLPNENTDLTKWSVVACDQYTSDHVYWDRVEKNVGKEPSTLRITLPEIFLESPDVESRIKSIHESMTSYLDNGIVQEYGKAIIYIERKTDSSGLRQGLLFAMDLERYDYARDSKTLIRATEGTIVERIPPRLRVRKEATFELPHIMILIDDPQKKLIESLVASLATKKSIYKIKLMEHGGTLTGYAIDDSESINLIADTLAVLYDTSCKTQNTDHPLFFAMGDGNHSLATAKAHWETTKKALRDAGATDDVIMAHPARFALAEIVNIHSPGLRFEPIHRAIFSDSINNMAEYVQKHPLVKSATLLDESSLKALLLSEDGQSKAGIWDGQSYFVLEFTDPTAKLPPAYIDEIFASYNAEFPSKAKIDFIHGWDDTKKLSKENALGCFVPVITRERLFQWVGKNGPLPRKAFSMGDAEEKKYYMECRKIR
jgi:Protein of unknown function (DUF1015)